MKYAVLIFAVMCILAGCFTRPLTQCPIPEPVGLGAELEAIGTWFTRLGLIAAGVALVVRFFVPSQLLTTIIIAGLFTALIGGIFIWLGSNIWLVVLACAAALLAWAYYHRAGIRRWLDRIKTNFSK